MTPHAEGPPVLVVEDDHFSRRFVELLVMRAGYQPYCADTAEAARAALLSRESGYFSCLLTDYSLPGETGLDLLAWVKRHDPTLAGVLMTADGRKSLVEDALQSGAVDFINKPLHVDQLREAIHHAISATAQRRQTAQMERDVEQVAEVQRRMVLGDAASAGLHKVCFHPKHQAGGDSFSQYQISRGRSVALMTDVSGHDLKAAFVSAYFQGMVRAMLESGSSLAGVFDRCNRFLLEEWGDAGAVAASIAACSVLLDWDSGTIEVLTCGAPDPVLAYPDGRLRSLRSGGSAPLGWFPDLAGGSVSIPLNTGEIFFWTDGLDDLARQLGVTAMSAAHALFAALEQNQSPPWLAQASDDIMVARLPLRRPDETARCADSRSSPLIAAEYSIADAGEIDALQAYWGKSLSFALPQLKDDTAHDLLLCSREAILNALRHACRTPQDRVTLQVSLLTTGPVLRVRVDDPGAGHSFDFEAHAEAATETLIERHRGLILMSQMPSAFHSGRNGASIVMDFCVEE